MTNKDAAIIIGNIPVPTDDECYTISEYQWAKAIAIDSLLSDKTVTANYVYDGLNYTCSNCGRSKPPGVVKYCCWCGAKIESYIKGDSYGRNEFAMETD